jgi:hypothetical protein
MALFAPVAPPQLLLELRAIGDFLPGTYHLLLAHDVLEQPHNYDPETGFIPPTSLVILDNSMIELGHPIEPEMLMDAAEIVKPKLIVLPDVRGDAKATVQLSLEMAAKYKLPNSDTRWMCVIQGRTDLEMYECAQALFAALGNKIGCWGIGRTAVEDLGSRVPLVKMLTGSFPLHGFYGKYVHLLGFSSSIKDDYEAMQLWGVLGIDSAVPLRMGQDKKLLSLDQVDPGPRGDFWTRHFDNVEAETIANLYIIRSWASNMLRFRSAALPSPVASTGTSVHRG